MTREAIVLVVAMGIGRVVMAAYDELTPPPAALASTQAVSPPSILEQGK